MFEPRLKEDISKLCERADHRFIFDSLYQEYSKVFLYSNENIYRMLQLLPRDLIHRKVLGILSGGTFPLESILYGFREIDCIDLNRFPFYFFELMLASFKGLDHKDFLKFWGYMESIKEKNDLFTETIYQKFSHFLPKSYQIAWDSFYDYTGGLGQNQGLIITNKKGHKPPSYLEKDVFLKLKRILLEEEVKLRYFSMNLGDLFAEGDLGNYGFIYFSNVVQYYDEQQLESSKQKIDFTYKTFQEKLEKGGIFLANYFLKESLLDTKIDLIFNRNEDLQENYWDVLLEQYGDVFCMKRVPNCQDYVLMATKR